jgi:hypothetical protein
MINEEILQRWTTPFCTFWLAFDKQLENHFLDGRFIETLWALINGKVMIIEIKVGFD